MVTTTTKRVDLRKRYREEIAAADWDRIRQNAENNPQWSEWGTIVGLDLLGSVLRLFPSGKIWAIWTSNQSAADVVRDMCYREALESVAEEHGMFIEEFSGDVFAGILLDDEQEAIVWYDRDRHYSDSGFYQDRELIARTGYELEQHMQLEGKYPGIYRYSSLDGIAYFPDWQDADGYEQDGEDHPIEDVPMMMAYVEAMLWSSVGDDESPLDESFSSEDLDAEARAKVYKECADFLMHPLVREALDSGAWTPEQLGHDFWLTRNGHGAGFWDREKGDLGDKLTSLAKPYGAQSAYPYDTDSGDTFIGLEG